MGSQIVRGKKKGRPSKADLAARRAAEEEDEHPRRSYNYLHHLQSHHKRRRRWSEDEETEEQRDLRRSLRRRRAVRYNLIDYDEDYWEGEDDDFVLPDEEEEEEEQEPEPAREDEEDEDERREKKLKLVVKLPNRKTSNNISGRNDRNGSILNCGNSASRTPVGFNYGKEDEEDEEEEDRGESEDGAGEEEENEEEEENQVFKKRKVDRGGDYDEDDNDYEEDDENRGRREEEESNRRDSVPGTPNEVPAQTPMPGKKQLELILDKLQKKDTYGVYAEPVDPDELPDYHDLIEHPMDFGTVRKQLANGEYSSLEQFESDVYLICSNAMQYNAPDTIYHRQARAIKELAEKKFHRVRMRTEQMVFDVNLPEQKTKPSPIAIKKQSRKSHNRNVLEPVDSDLSAGTTLAAGDAHYTTGSAGPTSNYDRTISNEVLMDRIPAVTDSYNEKAEDAQSVKLQGARLGRKVFIVDENRRETYDVFNQPVDRSDLVLAAFEDEEKLLIPVGLYGDHSYAQSLARFAATLGPIAWKMASKRIEQSLPLGLEFGRGWVGEFEPVSTPLLYTATASDARKTNPFVKDVQNHALPVTGDKHPANIIASNEFRDSEPISNGKLSFSSYSGGREPAPPCSAVVQQQFPFLGKLQHVVTPMKKSNESLPRVGTEDDHVKDRRTASDVKPSLLPGFSGSKPAVTPLDASHLQHNSFIRKLWNGTVPGESHNPVQRPVPSNECLGDGHVLECKPSPHPDSRGSESATPSNGISNKLRNPFSRSHGSGPQPMTVNKVEVTSPTSVTNQNSDNSQLKELSCGVETATTRNMNSLQSIPFRKSSPSNNGGAISGVEFADEKKNTRKNVFVDINQPASSSSSGASPSHTIGMTKMAFLPRPDHQGLSDPVQVMKNLAHNAQNSQNNNRWKNSSITPTQIGPSVQSSRVGASNLGCPVSQAPGVWMRMGPGAVKLNSETLSGHSRSQMSEGSSLLREGHRPQMSQSPHGEINPSARMNFFPFQGFIPQPIRPNNEAQFQHQRPPMLFPQLMMHDPSRVQHVHSLNPHWKGISPHTTTQPKQKQDTLKPDLNIAFQSTVDSQQPDLALQL